MILYTLIGVLGDKAVEAAVALSLTSSIISYYYLCNRDVDDDIYLRELLGKLT